MSTTKESLGIQRVASVHIFVRDLERVRDWHVNSLDFAEIAVSTPGFEAEHHARASVVEAGGVRYVFMEPLGSKGESVQWLQKHPDGIGRIVFDVTDAERAFNLLNHRGATPMTGLERRVVEGGKVIWFDIATPFGDTLFRFVEHCGTTPVMPGLVRHVHPQGGTNRFGLQSVDHITSNFLTIKPAILWMEHVMGLERYWGVEFHTNDVKNGDGEGSGLKSVVMWDPESGVKFANNEPAAPAFKSSQIYKFCEDHHGPGVQHLAVTVNDLVGAVRGMRDRGVPFMPTPGMYYDLLPQRLKEHGIRLDEEIDALRRLEILVDGSSPTHYLLQIFLREAATIFKDPQAGPLFLELIQRKGDNGFGAGNFRALFESIENQQQSEKADVTIFQPTTEDRIAIDDFHPREIAAVR
jgi:4-hydroxyphenylpyruvate dioxygenase